MIVRAKKTKQTTTKKLTKKTDALFWLFLAVHTQICIHAQHHTKPQKHIC